MEHMRRVAFEIVLRACGFGALAIFCLMFGMSYAPKAAFQIGGFLTLLMCAILILKAYEANTKNYRHTELWLCLDEGAPAPRRLCATDERDGVARNLPAVRAVGFRVAIGLWSIALFLPMNTLSPN